MPVTITITGEDAYQAIVELRDLGEALNQVIFRKERFSHRDEAALEPVDSLSKVSENATDSGETDAPAAPARRGRKPKAAEPAPAASAAPEPTPEPAPAAAAPEPTPEPAPAAAEQAPTPEPAPAAAEQAPDPQPTGEPITHDSLRALLGLYVKGFGMPAALEDGPKIIGYEKVGQIPDGEVAAVHAKASAIVNDCLARKERFGG